MKAIQLQPYQTEAINVIQEALNCGKQHIVVEMAAGCEKGIVFAKTLEKLNRMNTGRILVVTGDLVLKKKVEHELSTNYQGFIQVDNNSIAVETEHRILKYRSININEFQVLIFYDATIAKDIYETFACKEKKVVVFSTSNVKIKHKNFLSGEVVFSYGYEEAVRDGVITPAMDAEAFEPAVEVFSKQLLKQFGYTPVNCHDIQDCDWDLIVQKGERKIWVECKTYKSQVVSPTAANSLLNAIVMRKMRTCGQQREIVLLIVFSKIPSFQRDEIYQRYNIIVWDIENLLFYSKNSPTLQKLLSQITYFPLEYIEGKCFEQSEAIGLFLEPSEDEMLQEAKKEDSEINELIRCLRACKEGRDYSREYEELCERILHTLFGANYFNQLTSQHKTEDEHFRMDLIGSLKINQNNKESMHPLWQMLVQHYNSHFVVFEFKNYSEKIDQNLIYITEKYLYDAALRNVALIVSRKGFSKAAKFAAKGCLKEHGKLILNITDNDLIKMLKLKSDKAADYLLEKLEEFLMGISK